MTSHWNSSSVVGKEFVEIIFPNFHQIFLSTPPVRSGGRDVSHIPRVGDIIWTFYLLFNNEDDDDYFDDEANNAPRSRPCSLEEQYFKCGIFWDYDAPQRRVSNSEAPVLAGGIPVFLRGSQFSGASELKEGAGEQI